MLVRRPVIMLALGLATLVTTVGVAPAVADETPTTSIDAGTSPTPDPTSVGEEGSESTSADPSDDTTTTLPSPPAAETSSATPTPTESAAPTPSRQTSEQPNRLTTAAADGHFTYPTGGESLAAGTPLTFQVSASGSWYVDLYCAGDYVDGASSSNPSTTLPELSRAGECDAELYVLDETYGYYRYQDSVSYSVHPVQQANEIRRLSANRTAFYPRVRDNYRDSARFALTTRGDALVTMAVRNSDGRTIRTATVHRARSWDDYYGRDWISWNGKNNAGNKVAVGRYRVVFTSEGENLTRTTESMTVKVATGFRTVHRTSSKDGWWGSVDQTRGLCWADETYYPHGNFLDCWGGAYAQATYTFRVPANATVTDWWARGNRHCCTNGRVIKSGDRVASRRYRVRVRVTNWASYTVRSAGISYKVRQRI